MDQARPTSLSLLPVLLAVVAALAVAVLLLVGFGGLGSSMASNGWKSHPVASNGWKIGPTDSSNGWK